MDVGSELRQAREQQGLSLRQVADVTKIRLSVLRAIENNDTTSLPGGIYTRSFVKAYAREVGLDPTTIARRFAEQFDQPITPISRSDQPPVVDPSRLRSATESARSAGAIAAAVLILIACLLTLFNAWNKTRVLRHVEDAPASELVSVPQLPQSQHTSAISVQTTTASSSDATANRGDTVLRVDLVSRGLCWISADADGKRVAYRLMDAGERQTIEVRRELVLRIGEPANLDVSINGSSGRPLGRAGEPATVRVTPQNYRDFLNP